MTLSSRRICNLLLEWKEHYPTDFAAVGSHGALSALLKQIISNMHLVHYGSDLLPLLEQLPSLRDRETTWCKQESNRHLLGDDESDMEDSEDEITREATTAIDSDTITSRRTNGHESKGKSRASLTTGPVADETGVMSRTRSGTGTSASTMNADVARSVFSSASSTGLISPGALGRIDEPRGGDAVMTVDGAERYQPLFVEPRKLHRISGLVLTCEPTYMAQEITRKMAAMFVRIEVRSSPRNEAWINERCVSGSRLASPCPEQHRLEQGGRFYWPTPAMFQLPRLLVRAQFSARYPWS